MPRLTGLRPTLLGLAGLACLLLSTPAQAQDDSPRDVYRHCLRHLRTLVDRCQSRQAEIVKDCLQRIRRLKAEGKQEEAIATARRCVRAIEELTVRCADEIQETCRRCQAKLRALGAEELAAKLETVCEDALLAIRKSAARAIQAIKQAV